MLLSCINMLVLNMCVRLHFIKEYRCYCKKKDENSLSQLFEKYYGENIFTIVIQTFNIIINVLLLLGWFKILLTTYILPFTNFLSTQVR